MGPENDLLRLLTIFRRRRRMILAMTLAGTVMVALAAQLIPPKYTAKAEIVVDPDSPSQVTTATQPVDPAAVLTEVTALNSHDLLQDVLQALQHNPAFRSPRDAEGGHEAVVGKPGGLSGAIASVRAQFVALSARARQKLSGGPGVPAYRDLISNLRVFQESGSHAIAVTFKSTDPVKAALVANTIVERHLQDLTSQQRLSTDRRLAWLGERIRTVEGEMKTLDEEARRHWAANELAGSTDAAEKQAADLSHQIVAAEVDLSARRERLERVRALRLNHASGEALFASLNIPGLADLRNRELALQQERAASGTSMSGSNPAVQRIRSQQREVEQQTAEMVARAVHGLENEVGIAAARVELLQSRLAPLRARIGDPKQQDLDRAIAFRSGLLKDLMQRQQAVRESRESYTPAVHVLSLAAVPDRPNSIRPILLVPPALIFSFVGATMVALLRDRLDRTLHTAQEVREVLGIPCVGFVPKMRRPGRVRLHQRLLKEPHSPYTEAIRSAATNLQLVQARGRRQVVLVSSSVPGEGKTTFAVSLATFVSQLGRRVLLVDLDFRHPSVLRELGAGSPRAVVDIAARHPPVNAIIQQVPGLNLDYLSARRGGADPLTLFASEDMSHLIAKLRTLYDCVIIDSAPLLAIAESRLLATMVDRTALVVKWAETRSDIARNAVDLLRAPGLLDPNRPDTIGVVLVQVDLKKHARGRYGDLGEIAMKYRSYYAKLDG
jgi:polysaccharide biosynthesis transport protein